MFKSWRDNEKGKFRRLAHDSHPHHLFFVLVSDIPSPFFFCVPLYLFPILFQALQTDSQLILLPMLRHSPVRVIKEVYGRENFTTFISGKHNVSCLEFLAFFFRLPSLFSYSPYFPSTPRSLCMCSDTIYTQQVKR